MGPVVELSAMEGARLGYGTQISLDGAYAKAEALTRASEAVKIIAELVATAEPLEARELSERAVVLEDGEDGYSVSIAFGETTCTAHSFPRLRTVSLHLFSAHQLDLSAVQRLFLEGYEVGRFRSSVREFGLYPPSGEARSLKSLAGERAYARLRLTPIPEAGTT